MLGRGAQGSVFLASDPELGRLVAIKTLTLDGEGGAKRIERLTQEARTASALSHPNLVPVYEVGSHRGMSYVVFEYVEGRTLADLLRADGAMPQSRAVITMSQILAGIAHAHGKALVHGDITPSNILLGSTGVPRITDFGISRDLFSSPSQVPTGTLRYMAPEHFNGGKPDLRADVFALGLVFWEMLVGEPAIGGGNDFAAIYQTLNQPIGKPSSRRADIDPRLDAIVCRAVEKDPEARFPDAAAMKEELDRFRVPTTSVGRMELTHSQTHSTVEFLLRRMRHKSEFPVLSQRFADINRLTGDHSDASLHKLANVVLQDFALTQKLLKVVNSAAFGGNGRITNVSQAILKLGLEQVRVIATGLMLATPPHGRAMHPGLPEVLLGAFVAGVMGRTLGRMAGLKNVEELFICSMFSRLGEILAIYYFAEDYDEIVRVVRTQGVKDSMASREVLGIGFDELGIEVARRWNFPPNVLYAMRELPEGELPAAPTERERIAHCAGFARELCDAAWRTPTAKREDVLSALIARFSATIPSAQSHLAPLIAHALDIGQTYCQVIGLPTSGSALIEGLTGWMPKPDAAPVASPRTAPARGPGTSESKSAPAAKPSSPAAAQAAAKKPISAEKPAAPQAGWLGRLFGKR